MPPRYFWSERPQQERRWQESSPKPPIISFADASEFRSQLESATKEEFEEYKRNIDEFNRQEKRFAAWVITVPSFEQFWRGYIIRANLNDAAKLPPAVGQSCKLRFFNEDGEFSPWYACRRGPEIISLNENWNNSVEMVVDVAVVEPGFEQCLVPLFNRGTTFRDLHPKMSRSVGVQLQLEASKATMLAKLGALERLLVGYQQASGRRCRQNALNVQPARHRKIHHSE